MSDRDDHLLAPFLMFVGLVMRSADDSEIEELETLADALLPGNGAFRDWEARSFNRGIRPLSDLCDAMVLP